jgi:transcription initiation factor IIE alpha subunit
METKILADLQDLSDNREVTLDEGKNFLLAIWEEDTAGEFETEEEHNDYLDFIQNISDWETLDDKLNLCDYIIFDSIQELRDADTSGSVYLCNDCHEMHEELSTSCEICGGALREAAKEDIGHE